jgi:molybdate transport system substrate-binding protein
MPQPPRPPPQSKTVAHNLLAIIRWIALALTLLNVGCRSEGTTRENPTLRVAVATNFASTANDIARAFEKETGENVELSFGSSGKLFAQITEGAPYDLFLSADAERPTRLLAAGHGVAGSLFTYAEGRLALLCSKKREAVCQRVNTSPNQSRELVKWLSESEGKLSLADPTLAPYGLAAREVLTTSVPWGDLKWQMILAESVGQAFHFVATENVDAGFVALAQVRGTPAVFVPVPDELHSPIRQKALLLRESPRAKAFWSFLRESPVALRLIAEAGYRLASDEPPKDP